VEGIEWIVVGIIFVVLFLMGPKKIPELAKSFGQAVGNFRKALSESMKEVTDEPKKE